MARYAAILLRRNGSACNTIANQYLRGQIMDEVMPFARDLKRRSALCGKMTDTVEMRSWTRRHSERNQKNTLALSFPPAARRF
jgi:hypothetical protein